MQVKLTHCLVYGLSFPSWQGPADIEKKKQFISITVESFSNALWGTQPVTSRLQIFQNRCDCNKDP